MTFRTEQEEFWAGEFGTNYIDRNNSETAIYARISVFSRMLRAAGNVGSVRELGCNIGLNLVALSMLRPGLHLSGYEINEEAARQARQSGVADIRQASILEKISDGEVDLTFTAGVLIHINPDFLGNVYDNLVEGSRRYVLVAEYYNPSPMEVVYRGHDRGLFKRDFAGDLIDRYGLKLIDYGFFYRRDNWTPQDDITWFLLEK